MEKLTSRLVYVCKVCKAAPRVLGVLAIVVVGPAAASESALPAPTGPYSVGTVALHFVDEERKEWLTEDPDDVRELMVQVWYPAQSVDGYPAEPFLSDDEDVLAYSFGPKAATPMGIPPAALEEKLGSATTSSHLGAPLAEKPARFPVVIFSHGFGGFRSQNRFQTEELASHGYVVVGIDHTYCNSVTRFPDGRLATFAPGIDQRDRSIPKEEVDAHFDKLAELWALDAIFVLDELTRMNADENGPAFGRLDLEKIGIFGHSFGGSTAGEAMMLDERFDAGINMDGMPYGQQSIEGVDGPFLFIRAERAPADPAMLALGGQSEEEYEALFDEFDRRVDVIAQGSEAGFLVVLDDTKHFNFSDFPLFAELSPLAPMVLGDLDASLGVEILNGYTLAFFDRFLRGSDGDLLGSEPPWEVVTLRAYAQGAEPD